MIVPYPRVYRINKKQPKSAEFRVFCQGKLKEASASFLGKTSRPYISLLLRGSLN